MTALLALLVLGAVSWVLRITFVTVLPADRLPARVRNGLEYLAPAVLASIIAVELMHLVHNADPVDLTLLLAGSTTIAWVAHRTRNISLACALGVAVVLLLDYAPL